MYLLGLDIGSSSVKASLLDAETGRNISSCFYPKKEMPIRSEKAGFSEQDPEMWWKYTIKAVRKTIKQSGVSPEGVGAVGISYQMHGLVMVDRNLNIIRPSIIWCDSRATTIGERAFNDIGRGKCLEHLLNSPGNFTASKLKWVKDNQPDLYERAYRIMLPGDYIGMKITGEIRTTISGMSEGVLWDFKNNEAASFLLDYYGLDSSLLPEIVPAFAEQGAVTKKASELLGIPEGVPLAYRAGDQPNNAFSLNVLNPGEIAAVAGTSGVVYGVSDEIRYDPLSRINTFAHVNHNSDKTRLGVLLCINGTGILNSWLRTNISCGGSYEKINNEAASIRTGSDGLVVLPFGNGAERMLGNINKGAGICNLDLNIHTYKHILRAAHEGIAFSFRYGMDIMKETGIHPVIIRAGYGNMFLSKVFRETLSGISGAVIELYNTDGAQGAARAAGIGAGVYKSDAEAFRGLAVVDRIEPDRSGREEYAAAYEKWKNELNKYLKEKI